MSIKHKNHINQWTEAQNQKCAVQIRIVHNTIAAASHVINLKERESDSRISHFSAYRYCRPVESEMQHPEPTAPEPASDFTCALNNVRFPSFKKSEMRVTLNVGDESSVVIWAESKATKAQWQLEIRDVSKHGPNGLPANVVFNFLKAVLSYILLFDLTRYFG